MRSGPVAIVGVLLGLTLILPDCGGEPTASGGERAPSVSATTASDSGIRVGRVKAAAAKKRCGKLLGDFLDPMESLDNSLAVGLDYESYLRAVNNVRATYAELNADRLPLVCLASVGAPAEQALNAYIESANTWGDCLASPSCNDKSVEPEVQRSWEHAADLLAQAQSGLRGG